MKRFFLPLLGILVLFCGCRKEEKSSVRLMEKGGNMKLTSSAFEDGQRIPIKYTADGEDISPPLSIEAVPDGTESLVLVVDDPDAPMGTWDHWLIWNIPADTKEIKEGASPEGISGINGWGRPGYRGPAPPSGTHRYFFKLYALSSMLDIQDGATKKILEKAMNGLILEKVELMGKYSR